MTLQRSERAVQQAADFLWSHPGPGHIHTAGATSLTPTLVLYTLHALKHSQELIPLFSGVKHPHAQVARTARHGPDVRMVCVWTGQSIVFNKYKKNLREVSNEVQLLEIVSAYCFKLESFFHEKN